MLEMEVKKSKLNELLDIISSIVAKGKKYQSNKGEVEINKVGAISITSHEPSDMDESYVDQWTKITCEGKKFELKWDVRATEGVPEYKAIRTANIEFSVSIKVLTGTKKTELIEPVTITQMY